MRMARGADSDEVEAVAAAPVSKPVKSPSLSRHSSGVARTIRQSNALLKPASPAMNARSNGAAPNGTNGHDDAEKFFA
jgi:hypothetical protein